MTQFALGTYRNSSVWYLYRARHDINLNPDYQRQSDIWSLEKKQLFLDTIINKFDVPKLYMHRHRTPVRRGSNSYEYSVVDGKQRLSAIFNFIDNRYALDDDFCYLADKDVSLGGLTYKELAKKFPDIKADFDAFNLNVVTIEAEDLEVIEDLFSRLNEAVPLNAAEKRNAKHGLLPKAVREISKHAFFMEKLPFKNTRYRHFDIIAKMLFFTNGKGIMDTKKVYLDRFFEQNEEISSKKIKKLRDPVFESLDNMENVFINEDHLLRSVGMVSIYFLLFERASKRNLLSELTRNSLCQFDDKRKENRELAKKNMSKADYDLLEFDRLAQSPNDRIAMQLRLAVMDDELFDGELGFVDGRLLTK